METVLGTESCQRGNVAERGIIRFILFGRNSRSSTVNDFQLAGFGKYDPLAHVCDDFVRHDHNRHAVFLCQIEGTHSLLEQFLNRSWNKANSGVITVGAPFGTHYVRLTGAGRHPGRRAATHDVNDNTRGLGNAGITNSSCLRESPGPEVDVKTLAPVREAPIIEAMAPISSSI